MAKKNRVYNLTLLASLFTLTVSSCSPSSSSNPTQQTLPLDLTGVEFNSRSFTYDGSPHSIYATNVPDGITVTYENNGAISVGKHKVIAHFSKKTSGTSSSTKYQETIKIADLTITVDADHQDTSLSEKLNALVFEDINETYDGSAKFVKLKNPESIPAGFTALYDNNVHSNAGEYAATCKIVKDDTMVVYKTFHAKMIIEKAGIDIANVKFEDVTYPSDGKVHILEATNLPDKVAVRYEYINGNTDKDLDANAIINVGYKRVRAVFSIDPTSGLDRTNYKIVNSANSNSNSKEATINILAAGSLQITFKYQNKHFKETLDKNNVIKREEQLDSSIYSQNVINVNFGDYVTRGSLVEREGYELEISNKNDSKYNYNDILTERGCLITDDKTTTRDVFINYIPKIYNVDFAIENGQMNSRTYTIEDSVGLLDPQVSDGYKFIGWYADSNYNIPLSSLKGLTGDRTIYGRTIKDEKINTFEVHDTFVSWDGQGKNIETKGSLPSDVVATYEYYEINSNGEEILINGVDSNKRPTEIGKYPVKVRFYTKKIDPETKQEYVSDEERYTMIQAYLVIQPRETDTSGVEFANTSFEYTGDKNKGNYPVLKNYPNSTDLKYEYYDSNMKQVGLYDQTNLIDTRPVSPGVYYVYASYIVADGSEKGQLKTHKATMTINKKSYSLDFINYLNQHIQNITYEITGDNVKITRGDSVSETKSLNSFVNTGYLLDFQKGNGLDGVTVTFNTDNTITFSFKNSSYPSLILKWSNNKINFNNVGTLEGMAYFEFEDPSNASNYYLPSSVYRTITVFTSGSNSVIFKKEDGTIVASNLVKTGASVATPQFDETMQPKDNYEAYWESDNKYSTLDHIIGDTTFTLKYRAIKHTIKFELDENSIGTIDRLPTQEYSVETETTFGSFDVNNLVYTGYRFVRFYLINKSGEIINIQNDWTFAKAGLQYDNSKSTLSDIVVYILTAANQTTGYFDANGGILSDSSTLTQTFGQPYNLPKINPIYQGYIFLGWSLNGVMIAENTIYSQFISSGSLRFKAEYSRPTNFVTFLPENGDMYTQYEVKEGDVINIPLSPEKAGYIFLGWYTSSGEKLLENTKFTGTDSIVYVAKYEAISIDIKYHNNILGNQVDDETQEILANILGIKYGSKIPSPTDDFGSILNPPAISGYKFLGWSLDGNTLLTADNLLDSFSTKVVDDKLYYYLDIYPVYKNNNYKITYAYKVDGLLNETSDVIFNQNVDLINPPSRTGYYFAGWYTTSDLQDGTNFEKDILPNPQNPNVSKNCYPYENDIILYAKWIRKQYKVTFEYTDSKGNKTTYSPNNGLYISYGELLTSIGSGRTWLTSDEIYSTEVGKGLGLPLSISPVFTYKNGTVVKEGEAFLYNPAANETDDALIKKPYDIDNPENNTCTIYISSTVNNFFNISYISDGEGIPTIQSVAGNSDFFLANSPIREGKKFVAYFYYYKDDKNNTLKYYLTDNGKIDGKALEKWNLSSDSAKNGIVDYVLYAEYTPLKYRLFFKTNDQKSLIGTTNGYDNYVETSYGELYNILSNKYSSDFKSYIDEKLRETGYRFDFWRDNFGRIITSNTILTDPKALDIDSTTYYKADGSIDYDKSNLTAGIYLYAQVKPLTYTITYLPDNNSNPYVINVSYNEAYSKMGNPTKTGYRFSGWKYFKSDKFDIDKYRNNTLDADALITNMNELSFNQVCDVVAVAQYIGDEYTITYKYKVLNMTNSGFTINSTYDSSTTLTDVVKYKDKYTIKSFDYFGSNVNVNYKYLLKFYDFVGWQDEQTLRIYSPNSIMEEYLKTADSSFIALYSPKQFTVEFSYVQEEKNNISGTTISTTKIAKREKVTLNDSLSTPGDPLPSSTTTYGSNKTWRPKDNITPYEDSKVTKAQLDFEFEFNFDNICLYFYRNDYTKFKEAVEKLTDSNKETFFNRQFDLYVSDNSGYYSIILDNNTNLQINGNTVYDIYGNLNQSEGTTERGSKIKLPNIVGSINNNVSFKNIQPGGTSSSTKSINLDDIYKYSIDGVTYRPFLRTVYVINGSYYLDGDYSPIPVTGASSNDPTIFYAYTTYVAGQGTDNYHSELFNFTLKDSSGEYIKAHIIQDGNSVFDNTTTLDSINEIGFAGFMNKNYTNQAVTEDINPYNLVNRPVYIPYFYYDGLKIRKVSAIVEDSSGKGAFEDSGYGTKYYLPSTINYIAENSFKNTDKAFSNAVDKIKVIYLDSRSYFDSTVSLVDSTISKNQKLYAINTANMNYASKDDEASYDSRRFFYGRTYFLDFANEETEAINTYTVLSLINETLPKDWQQAGMDKKSGQYYYYSTTNVTKIPAYYMNLKDTLAQAVDNKRLNDTIITFSRTDNDLGSGNVKYNSYNSKDTMYPYYLYLGTNISFAKKYYSQAKVDALKITDEADKPNVQEGSTVKSYPNSPYYVVNKFFLTMPVSDYKTNDYFKADRPKDVNGLNAIYLDTSTNIVEKLYNSDPYYFVDEQGNGNGDPTQSYLDTDFVTCYKSFTNGSTGATLDYFYNGDDEAASLIGSEYLFKLLSAPDSDTYNYNKGQKLRENFNKKCYNYTYSKSGQIDLDNVNYTRLIATKNYKTKSLEYFFLGSYLDFLSLGKDVVDQYLGKQMSFILSDKQYDPNDPLSFIDEDSRLQTTYLGTSEDYLSSLSSDEIKTEIQEKRLIYCFTSNENYSLVGLFMGGIRDLMNLTSEEAKKIGKEDNTLIKCLNIGIYHPDIDTDLLRQTIYVYLNSDSDAIYTFTHDNYYFDEQGTFQQNNFSFMKQLIKSNTASFIYSFSANESDVTNIRRYYNKDAKVLANNELSNQSKNVILTLRQDFDVSSIDSKNLSANSFELTYVGLLPTSADEKNDIINKKDLYNLSNVNHFAYYLNDSLPSSIGYYLSSANGVQVAFGQNIYGDRSDSTYLNYFFNITKGDSKIKNVVTCSNGEIFYNDNIKTLLAGSTSLAFDLNTYLSNYIINALYSYDATSNSLLFTMFKQVYFGSRDQLLNYYENNGKRSALKSTRTDGGFVFVKPTIYSMNDKPLEDDMELVYLFDGESSNSFSNIDLVYLNTDGYDQTFLSMIKVASKDGVETGVGKNRLISVLNKNIYSTADGFSSDETKYEYVYYYPYQIFTSKDSESNPIADNTGWETIYKIDNGSLLYSNNFIHIAGYNYNFNDITDKKTPYNAFIGTYNQLDTIRSSSIYCNQLEFYAVLQSDSVTSNNTLANKELKYFYLGNPITVEEEFAKIDYTINNDGFVFDKSLYEDNFYKSHSSFVDQIFGSAEVTSTNPLNDILGGKTDDNKAGLINHGYVLLLSDVSKIYTNASDIRTDTSSKVVDYVSDSDMTKLYSQYMITDAGQINLTGIYYEKAKSNITVSGNTFFILRGNNSFKYAFFKNSEKNELTNKFSQIEASGSKEEAGSNIGIPYYFNIDDEFTFDDSTIFSFYKKRFILQAGYDSKTDVSIANDKNSKMIFLGTVKDYYTNRENPYYNNIDTLKDIKYKKLSHIESYGIFRVNERAINYADSNKCTIKTLIPFDTDDIIDGKSDKIWNDSLLQLDKRANNGILRLYSYLYEIRFDTFGSFIIGKGNKDVYHLGYSAKLNPIVTVVTKDNVLNMVNLDDNLNDKNSYNQLYVGRVTSTPTADYGTYTASDGTTIDNMLCSLQFNYDEFETFAAGGDTVIDADNNFDRFHYVEEGKSAIMIAKASSYMAAGERIILDTDDDETKITSTLEDTYVQILRDNTYADQLALFINKKMYNRTLTTDELNDESILQLDDISKLIAYNRPFTYEQEMSGDLSYSEVEVSEYFDPSLYLPVARQSRQSEKPHKITKLTQSVCFDWVGMIACKTEDSSSELKPAIIGLSSLYNSSNDYDRVNDAPFADFDEYGDSYPGGDKDNMKIAPIFYINYAAVGAYGPRITSMGIDETGQVSMKYMQRGYLYWRRMLYRLSGKAPGSQASNRKDEFTDVYTSYYKTGRFFVFANNALGCKFDGHYIGLAETKVPFDESITTANGGYWNISNDFYKGYFNLNNIWALNDSKFSSEEDYLTPTSK